MVDNRKIKTYCAETDERLELLSDTDIILEFSNALTDLYPHMINLCAHCYDPFDDVVENLYFNLAISALTGKYGIDVKINDTHKYGFFLPNYHTLTHVNAKPKVFPIPYAVDEDEEEKYLVQEDLENKELVFIQFGDSINWLSGGEEEIDYHTVNFDYCELKLVDSISGQDANGNVSYWIKKELLEFEWIVEEKVVS